MRLGWATGGMGYWWVGRVGLGYRREGPLVGGWVGLGWATGGKGEAGLGYRREGLLVGG